MPTAFVRSAFFLLAGTALLPAEPVRFKERCLDDLLSHVPSILRSQDKKTGRFGSGIWIVNDQNVMLPLAAAWSHAGGANRFHRSPEVLAAIVKGGDALIADQDADGRWEFRKKDGSTWGPIYMPWTYSRWIRAYALVREAMKPEDRARWEKALRLGYTGIARDLRNAVRIVNIPAHHAMGLWFAGETLGEPEWKKLAGEFLRKVAGKQHPDGYWSENKGPVVLYGFVYIDALGVYTAASRDESLLPNLRKAAVYHSYFTYPDGSDVETIDERNYYHAQVRLPNVGFTLTPEGRSHLARQLRLWKGRLPADEAASLLLWGREGEGAGRSVAEGDFDYILGAGDAAVRRRGPWFLAASAMTAPVPTSRWIQDRQNFVSVYHDDVGLVLGGGNTKLQPAWSSFTLGDTSLLRHKPGDENPKFLPPPGLTHVPDSARLLSGAEGWGVELSYGGRKGRVRLEVKGRDRLEYTISGDPALTAHIVAMTRLERPEAAAGKREELTATPFAGKVGGEPAAPPVSRLLLPAGAVMRWNLLPHDPYRKDGRADQDQGRVVIDLPLQGGSGTLTVEIGR